LAKDRYDSDTDTAISYYAIAEVPDLYDQLALFVHPQLTALKTVDFAYVRNQRPLRYSGYNVLVDHAGTLEVTAGSTAGVGTSTVFESDMVGAIIRIGSHADEAPTGRSGEQPYVEERSIASVTDSTHITFDNNIVTAREAATYRVTDPVDIGRVAKNAFLTCCRRNVARTIALDKGDSDGTSVLRQVTPLTVRGGSESWGTVYKQTSKRRSARTACRNGRI